MSPIGWGDDLTADELAAVEKRRQPIRDRASKRLERARDRLPRLTAAQVEIIVEMMVDAYEAGEMDSCQVAYQEEWHKAKERSLQAVAARRRKSKRHEIIAAFKAASGKDVSIDQLAKEHGVSRATAYRAVGMIGKKPTTKPKK